MDVLDLWLQSYTKKKTVGYDSPRQVRAIILTKAGWAWHAIIRMDGSETARFHKRQSSGSRQAGWIAQYNITIHYQALNKTPLWHSAYTAFQYIDRDYK